MIIVIMAGRGPSPDRTHSLPMINTIKEQCALS
jgi:hypothetical protein